MSMELCVGNYETLDGFMNCANGIFEDFTKNTSKLIIWIHFFNPQIGHNTWIKNLQIYENSWS